MLGTKRRRPWGHEVVGGFWLLAHGLLAPTADAGQCVFRQICASPTNALDTDCTPTLTDSTVLPDGSYADASFPLDEAHGFGVRHDGVWNGYYADEQGNCGDGFRVDLDTEKCVADGFEPSPIVCPQYKDDGCCTWQQNRVLYNNLVKLAGVFGGNAGCTACVVNLVNLWCGIVCSPDQSVFLRPHDPPYSRKKDNINKGQDSVPVLEMDMWIDPAFACALYDSCKGVSIVSSVSAMQSGLGLLNFQAQTGAVQYGEYFNFHFGNDTGMSRFSVDTLSCGGFRDPGTTTVPFPSPTPANNTWTQCDCTVCAESCSGVSVTIKPISPLDGFNGALVLYVYLGIAAFLMVVKGTQWYRRRKRGEHDSRLLRSDSSIDAQELREPLLLHQTHQHDDDDDEYEAEDSDVYEDGDRRQLLQQQQQQRQGQGHTQDQRRIYRHGHHRSEEYDGDDEGLSGSGSGGGVGRRNSSGGSSTGSRMEAAAGRPGEGDDDDDDGGCAHGDGGCDEGKHDGGGGERRGDSDDVVGDDGQDESKEIAHDSHDT